MYFNVAFLDEKSYQSLSFDADMKLPEASLYSKKVWILKEYKKEGGKIHLSESEERPITFKPNVSYSLKKTFCGDELIVELVSEHRFCDDFDYFAEAEIEEDTGDEELNSILSKIKDSGFDQSIIKAFILDIDPEDESEEESEGESECKCDSECGSECECDCDCE